MKFHFLIIIVLFLNFFSLLFCQQQNPTVRILTLERSLFYAENNRKEILLANNEVALAKERISEANSFNYPKIDLTFNYSQIDTDRIMILPPGFSSILLPVPQTFLPHYYFTRLSLWQQIYTGGRYSSNLKLAQSNLAKVETNLNISLNEVHFEVKKKFYSLSAVEKKINVYETIISSISSLIPDTFTVVSAKELKIQNSIYQIKDEFDLIKKENQQARLDFLNTVGLELDTEFSIDDKFLPVTEKYDLNKLSVWAFQYRAEPKKVQMQEEMDALGVKLSIAVRYPSVTLGAHYEFAGEEFSFAKKNWNATINFSLPLFDGWASWSRIKQKHIQSQQSKLQRKEMEDAIRIELKKSYNNYNFWIEKVKYYKDQIKEKEKLFDSIDKNDYELLVEYFRTYLIFKIKYIDAVQQSLISYSQIEHSIGKPLE